MARLSSARISPAEQLELRILPTVKVNFNPNNDLLKITGDNSNNIVENDRLRKLITPRKGSRSQSP